MTLDDKIREIEEEIQKTPYNKATQHHIGKLKAKLARLKDEVVKRASSGGKSIGFAVKKSGHATAVLVGFPSVGKSTLLNRLANTDSKVAEYDFTTLDVIPGMMEYDGAKIQILDIPGIISGASAGKGRGKEVLSIARNTDLTLILVDNIEQTKVIRKELYDVGIRLDETPPKVTVKKTLRGGVHLNSTVKLTKINEDVVRAVLNEYGIHNADVVVREDLGEDRLIDAVIGNRIYIPSLVVLNKIDLFSEEKIKALRSGIRGGIVEISATKGINIDELRRRIYERLGVMKIYMKPHGREPDFREPLIVRKNTTISGVCDILHRDFRRKFKYAQVWGKSVKFEAQAVGLNHVLKDGDILTIVKKT